MHNTKLVILLNHFSGFELNNFYKYLVSPMVNEQKELIAFFEAIKKELPIQEMGKEVNRLKARLWRQVFSNKTFNDVKFRRICSDLTKLAVQFLAYQEYKKSDLAERMFSMNALNKPKWEKHFHGAVRSMKLALDRYPHRNAQFHFYQYQIERNSHEFMEKQGKKRNDLENLEKADFALDCYYYANKLKHYCDILGYKNFLSLNSDIVLPEGMSDYIEASVYAEESAVKVYLLIKKMFDDPDEEQHFFELKAFINELAGLFNKEELKTIYTHLINYCIDTKINRGRPDYFKELFALYIALLEKEIILEKGVLPPSHYKNIIAVGLQVGDFDWVETFIRNYTEKLPKENQENALNYNLALLYYNKGDYNRVIELLREVEYKDIVYALGSRTLLLRTYFETQEFLALDSLIDSFRIYLKRNKLISKDTKQAYSNAIRFTKKLTSLDYKNSDQLEKLKTQIQDCKTLGIKRWLLDKVKEAAG